jgi:hypothetical protein
MSTTPTTGGEGNPGCCDPLPSSAAYPNGGTPPPTTVTTVAVVPAKPPVDHGLAVTGGDALGLAGIGLVLVLLGASLARRFGTIRA